MHTFITTTVNRQEAEALKEMIFKRVRERAESMNAETQQAYTEAVQSDVMDLARMSFAQNTNNPFTLENASEAQKNVESKPQEQEAKVDSFENQNIGFAKKHNPQISTKIEQLQVESKEDYKKTTIESGMEEARRGLEKNSGFMGALNFLNSQATIELVRKKGKKFEAMA